MDGCCERLSKTGGSRESLNPDEWVRTDAGKGCVIVVDAELTWAGIICQVNVNLT